VFDLSQAIDQCVDHTEQQGTSSNIPLKGRNFDLNDYRIISISAQSTFKTGISARLSLTQRKKKRRKKPRR
jgi:hypothetical protein